MSFSGPWVTHRSLCLSAPSASASEMKVRRESWTRRPRNPSRGEILLQPLEDGRVLEEVDSRRGRDEVVRAGRTAELLLASSKSRWRSP